MAEPVHSLSTHLAGSKPTNKLRWGIVPPNPDPCPKCIGTGSYWPKRKDGLPDLRYSSPVGPCPACNGSGRRSLLTKSAHLDDQKGGGHDG